jgi:O-antigen/teichoic acid export membrane protein
MNYQLFSRNSFIKTYSRLILSVSNISRTLFASVLGLLINYILINFKSGPILDKYVYAITIVNLLFVFCNWGGKDFSVKKLAAQTHNLGETINSLTGSRLLLYLMVILPVILIPAEPLLKIFIAIYLLIKILLSVYDPLITIQKKFTRFFIIDLVLSTALLVVIFTDGNSNSPGIFLFEVVAVELIRLAITSYTFRNFINPGFSYSKSLSLLKESRHFFFIALAGFICSRADLYVVGLLLESHVLSYYFIILNIVALCQVAFAGLVNTFSANIFRVADNTFNKVGKRVIFLGLGFAFFSAVFFYLICEYFYHITTGIYMTIMVFMNILFFVSGLIEMYRFTRDDRQLAILNVLLISGATHIILSYIFAKNYMIEGAFASNTFTLLLTYLLLKYHAFRARN